MPARRVDSHFSTPATPGFLDQVRRAGGNADALRQRFQLPEEPQAQAEVRFNFSRFRDFSEAAEKEARDEWLGLHAGQTPRRGLYGLLEFSSRTASTFHDALQRIVQFIPLINDVSIVTLEQQGGLALLELRVPGQPLMFGRHGNEFAISVIVHISRQLLARPFSPAHVWFAHPRPSGLPVDELTRVLGTTDVTFEAGANGMSVREEMLGLPVVTADPALSSLLDRQASLSIAGRSTPDDFLGRARRQVTAALREGKPTLVHVAKRLHMSERTLQRRLLDEGLSFQELLDNTRWTLARAWLEDPRLTLSEVSHRLGYADPRAFARAFKRWTGKTPGKTRTPETDEGASDG